METVSALLAICAGNSPVPGELPAQRPVTRGFDVFFDLRPDKRLNKQSWGWWFQTPSHSLWRHRNILIFFRWTSWRLKSLATLKFVQTENKGNIQVPHYWPSVRGVHRSSVDSSHKGASNAESVPLISFSNRFLQLRWLTKYSDISRLDWMTRIHIYIYIYHKISIIRRTKSQNLNVSRLGLQLSLHNILKPSVKWRMKM